MGKRSQIVRWMGVVLWASGRNRWKASRSFRRYADTPTRWLTVAGVVLWLATPSQSAPDKDKSEPARGGGESPMIEAVDVPTAEILDPATYAVHFRFYRQGGIMSRLILGPLKRVNLGVSFDAQRVIGDDDPHMIRPSVFFKLRFFDGSDVLPAFALGYDSQGYLYQESAKEFLHREKGLYVVASHEIFFPNFELHAGVNKYDFDDRSVFGFLGATLKISRSFALLSDYDNIQNVGDARFNMGGRYYVAPFFYVDIAARNIGRGSAKGAERMVRLNYVGNFPF